MKSNDTSGAVGAAINTALHDTAQTLRDTGVGFGHVGDAIVEDVRNGASHFGGMVHNGSSRAVQAMRETVQGRPTVTIGIAAGAGILLGLMLANRR